jgi:type IV secretion system protein VirB9
MTQAPQICAVRLGCSAVLLLFAPAAVSGAPLAATGAADPRLREVTYDPRAIVTVPVKRGVVTLVQLDSDEAITEVAAGLGGDCAKPEAAWCVAAQPGGRTLFVKAKSAASAPNNLAVVTDRRTHAFRFVVLAAGDPQPPVYRLVIRAPAAEAPHPHLVETAASLALPAIPRPPSPQAIVAERLKAKPVVRNTQYSLAEGAGSADIIPTLVFDDGRFTYLRFAGNREVPAVFQVLGDGSETVVNTRMEDDLLIVDRVSRRLTLRAGSAVVAVWNDAFDSDGVPPQDGTTVPGVVRTVRADPLPTAQAIVIPEVPHD